MQWPRCKHHQVFWYIMKLSKINVKQTVQWGVYLQVYQSFTKCFVAVVPNLFCKRYLDSPVSSTPAVMFQMLIWILFYSQSYKIDKSYNSGCYNISIHFNCSVWSSLNPFYYQMEWQKLGFDNLAIMFS